MVVPDGPPNSTPRRKVKLTFQNGTRDIALDNFVALVVLDPTRIDYGRTKPNGDDLRFIDPDNTPLSYEIDEWVPNGTSYVWVRVPLIDASSTTDCVYLHYGDPTSMAAQDPSAVWSGQSSVWHLSQDPGPGGNGDIKDSTATHNHGTTTATMQAADRVPAIIGKGFHFTGGQTGVTANALVLPLYTWSMWIRGDAAPQNGTSNTEPISNGDKNFNFAWDHSMPAFVGAAAQHDANNWQSIQPSTAWAATTWYFLASSYDGNQLCIYRNTEQAQCTASLGPLAPTSDFEIALQASGSTTFKGTLDEVRVTASVLSAKRLDAEYANQRASNAAPFVVFGPTELDP
jgi:Concanavalin A-like lectin/glucanases superfamily/Domain of unknown function (DUF2341)